MTPAIISDAKDTLSSGCATLGLSGCWERRERIGRTGDRLTFKLVGGGTSPLTFTKLALRNANDADLCDGGRAAAAGRPGRIDHRRRPGIADRHGRSGGAAAAGTDGDGAPRDADRHRCAARSDADSHRRGERGQHDGRRHTDGHDADGRGLGQREGADATSGVAGTSASGATQGDGTQPGGVSSGGVRGASSGGGAQSASGAGVGKFGSGPDSYAHKSDNYGTKAVALAALGFMLIVAGIWRRGVRDVRREAVRRR